MGLTQAPLPIGKAFPSLFPLPSTPSAPGDLSVLSFLGVRCSPQGPEYPGVAIPRLGVVFGHFWLLRFKGNAQLGLLSFKWSYPLVNKQCAIENGHL